MSAPGMSTQQAMLGMITGRWVSQMIGLAAELGIADLLREGTRSAEELAQATGCHPRSLYRVLRALAGAGVFTHVEPGRFGLNPMAECLRSDAPGSFRGMAIMVNREWTARSWANILHSARTGQTAFEQVFGIPIFDWFGKNPAEAEIFNDAMTSFSSVTGPAIAAGYDFSRFGTVVDVGGGHGQLLFEILRRHPSTGGVVSDLPHVMEGAREAIRRAGMDGRCRAEAADFFESVPAGGDAYMMKHILHDWDDERSARILANCRRRMDGAGALLVVEHVLPAGLEPSFTSLMDIEMLVNASGQERTEEEFRRLYATAGFRLTRVIPTASPVSIVEGVPA